MLLILSWSCKTVVCKYHVRPYESDHIECNKDTKIENVRLLILMFIIAKLQSTLFKQILKFDIIWSHIDAKNSLSEQEVTSIALPINVIRWLNILVFSNSKSFLCSKQLYNVNAATGFPSENPRSFVTHLKRASTLSYTQRKKKNDNCAKCFGTI